MKLKYLKKFSHFLLATSLLLGSHTAFAQMRIVGMISGTVTDPSGASVPGAKVALRDEVNGTRKETTSNGSGQYQFPDLPFGTFEVTVTATGFQSSITNHITVTASQTTDVPVTLRVGQQTETVTVEGVAPVLETTSQLIADTVQSKTVNELPLGARNALALAALVPGKTVGGAGGPGGVGNGDTRFNNVPGGAVEVTVDGINDASNGYKSGGTVFYTTVPVRLGALEEVSVESSGLGADSGAESGVNIKFITKRGGDQYHGSAFYQPTSEQFNANSWSNNSNRVPRAYNRVHNFGGNIGGKLVPFGFLKNKLFFFFNFEYVYNPQVSIQTYSVLTPEAAAGNYTYLVNGTTNQLATVNVLSLAASQGAPNKLDPVAQSIINTNAKIPSYATRIASSDFNRTSWQWNTSNNLYQYYPTTRFDYYITPKEQLTFSWNLQHSWQTGFSLLQGGNRINPFRIGGYFVWSAALQSTISATMFNEFRYGVQHSGDSNASATEGYGTYFTYNNVPLRIGNTLPFGATVPYRDQANVTGRHYITTIYDTLTKIKGNHTITVGGSFRSTDWHDTGETFRLPTYGLGTPSGDPLPGQLFTAATLPGDVNTDLGNASGAASLYNELTGRVASARLGVVVDPATKQYGGFINHTWTRTYMGGAYAQDRWRIKPNLTLNFGLRWEAQGDMYDVAGITAIPGISDIYGPSTSLFTPGTLSGNNNPVATIGHHPYKPDYKNFAPNLGFSWNPSSDSGILGKIIGTRKTVIRGGYSMSYYDEGTQMFAQNLGNNIGKTASQTLIPGQSILSTFTTLSDIVANPVSPSAFGGIAPYSPADIQANNTFSSLLYGMKPTLVAPYTINWNFGIQREIAKGTVLEVRYVGNQGHRSWRTSNLNEVNIFENGFLTEFKNAQNNLTINQANGKGATFQNNGLAGQVNLPIFDAAFGPRGTVPAIAAASGYQNPTFITNLQQGAAGSLAGTLATNQNYVCRMFGNSFNPCTQARIQPSSTQSYNAPGAGYPINFFVLNPYSAGNLLYVDDSGWSSYNGLQIQLRKQFSRGLTWTTNYTFSKSLTNLPADGSIQAADYLTWRNQALDRRPSLFDQKHVLQTFGTYELPIGKGKKFAINNRIVDSLLGGWTAGSIIQFATGTPFQLSGGFNTFNNQASGVQLAPGVTLDDIAAMFRGQTLQKINQTGNSNSLLARAGATDQTRLGVPLSLIGPDGRANPQVIVPNTTPGSLGQILYIYGKNSFNWDASITKNFKITERTKFALFASAYNILNHPQWGMPSTNVFSTSFGTVGAPSGSGPGGPNSGYRQLTFRGTLTF
jgi:hypothetical protein